MHAQTSTGHDKLAYTIDEAVRLTTLSRSTIKRAIATGKLPAKKMGTRVIILSNDLRCFIEG